MATELKRLNVTVAKTNERGLTTREHGPTTWFTVSKYPEGAPKPAIPPPGTECIITVDPRGFLAAVEQVEPPAVQAHDRHINDVDSAPTRDVVITRLACVKAASNFAAGRAEIKSSDVLTIAANFEGWVTR